MKAIVYHNYGSPDVLEFYAYVGIGRILRQWNELDNAYRYTTIEERFPMEVLFGLWAKTKIEPINNHKDFIENTISARIKIVWNFYFSSLNSTQTKVSTETRILCVHPVIKVLFSPYWLFIKPFSGIIRTEMLKIIK